MSERSATHSRVQAAAQTGLMRNVYLWMTGGLVLSGAVAWFVVSQDGLFRAILGNPLLYYGLIIGELALVWIWSSRIMTMDTGAAAGGFITFAGLNGVTLSVLAVVYTQQEIFDAFFIAAGMFAGMSLYGYLTKRDLTSVGSYLSMGLLGLVIAIVVNLLVGSGTLDLLISIGGVALFLGLTAYDTQVIKRWQAEAGTMPDGGMDETTYVRLSVLGAFKLYLDMLNLFLFLLRLGRR